MQLLKPGFNNYEEKVDLRFSVFISSVYDMEEWGKCVSKNIQYRFNEKKKNISVNGGRPGKIPPGFKTQEAKLYSFSRRLQKFLILVHKWWYF